MCFFALKHKEKVEIICINRFDILTNDILPKY